ncbi:uncharacterized protein LOC119835860 [Zerene cesonia]|uniref:uncharacterized protein LOC119835860 n=1 Tax=Zerene cesonia TaxID=33412 RepID=UPI0018E52265|nr:uncharacterized protein LOC119835860 [Zerene cesonia]
MFCQRCQHSLRNCEGIKCSSCDAKFHPRCSGASEQQLELEGGDRRRAWRCAACKQSPGHAHLSFPNLSALLAALNNIADKFELVNKIQLPKLNNDLSQMKLITEKIVKQNEQILHKFEELRKRQAEVRSSHRGHRRRDVTLSPRRAEGKGPTSVSAAGSADAEGAGGAGGGVGASELRARYRTRRRAYPLHNMFLMLNRSLYTTRRKAKR